MNVNKKIIFTTIILFIVIFAVCKASKVYILFENSNPHCIWINRKWEEPYYNREAGTYTYYMEKDGEQYACEMGGEGNNIIFKPNELLGDEQAKITNLTRIRDHEEYLFVYDNCIYKYDAENNEMTKLVDMGNKETPDIYRPVYKYVNDETIDYVDYNSDTFYGVDDSGKIQRFNFGNKVNVHTTKSAGFSFDEGKEYIYVMGISFVENVLEFSIFKEKIGEDKVKLTDTNGRKETAIYYDEDNHRFYFTDKVAGIINLVKCYDEVNDRITTEYGTLRSIQGISSK